MAFNLGVVKGIGFGYVVVLGVFWTDGKKFSKVTKVRKYEVCRGNFR